MKRPKIIYPLAEKSNTEPVDRITKMDNKKGAEEGIKTENDLGVSACSTGISKDTKEVVTNYTLKATTSIEKDKYDKDKTLIFKLNRSFPTKNVKDLLKEVQSMELEQNPEPIENADIAEEQIDTVKEEVEDDKNSANTVECLRAFETAFTAGTLQEAKQMLHKAERFDPSLDIEAKLSSVKAAITKEIANKKQINEIEKANKNCIITGE